MVLSLPHRPVCLQRFAGLFRAAGNLVQQPSLRRVWLASKENRFTANTTNAEGGLLLAVHAIVKELL